VSRREKYVEREGGPSPSDVCCAHAFLNVKRAQFFIIPCTQQYGNSCTANHGPAIPSVCIGLRSDWLWVGHVTRLVAISALFLVHQHQSLCELRTVRGISVGSKRLLAETRIFDFL
jgi:hypothetical protein